MSKEWRRILGFVGMGLVIATVYFWLDKSDVFSNRWIGPSMFWASLVICPGFFLLVLNVAGSELPVSSPTLAWLMIGLLDCLLYAFIGATFFGSRRKQEGPGSS